MGKVKGLETVVVASPSKLPSIPLRLYAGKSRQEVEDWARRNGACTVYTYTIPYKAGDQHIGAIEDKRSGTARPATSALTDG